jgi:signal transduction histidine kinase
VGDRRKALLDVDARRAAALANESYLAECNAQCLERLRWAALVALLPIYLAVLANLIAFSDRIHERIASFAVEATICVAGLLLCRLPGIERRAMRLSLVFVLSMMATLLWAVSLSPRDADVLVGMLVAAMVATALIFPWGFRHQVVVSAFIAVGYVVLLDWHVVGRERAANVLITLVGGVALSTVGALIIDRQRRATFVERAHARALARQRELLVEAGRDLNSTLELPYLVERIVHLGRALVGSDSVALTLRDPSKRSLRIAAIATAAGEGGNPHFVGIELAEADFEAFVEDITKSPTLEIVGEGTDGERHSSFITNGFGVSRMLCASIRRDDLLLGFLCFAQRGAEPPFRDDQRRLAEGLANQAAIALANARLVDELRTASNVKSEFVSTISHELRTPLNVILGFTEIAQDPGVDPGERQELLGKIDTAARELTGLIEDTLEIGRLDAGRSDPQPENMRLPELWADLERGCAWLPRKPNVTVEWRGGPADVELLTDARKLLVVMRNLVGNAVKFTERGRVCVEAQVLDEVVLLRVSDTGIGIARADQEAIFEMFRQGDSSDSRRFGGTGLGLYIVQRFVHQLGGGVTVASEVGQGAEFTVRLPRRAPARLVQPAA